MDHIERSENDEIDLNVAMETDGHDKSFRKKFVVYPLMEYLKKEDGLVNAVAKANLQKTLFIYGFKAETKKSKITSYLENLKLGTGWKCVLRTHNRPTALLLFSSPDSCDKSYDIIRSDLEEVSTQRLWSVAKASNYNQRIPPKNRLSRSKVIVRNVPFSVSEVQIFKWFKVCGPIVSIKFLTRIDNSGNLIRKGCCFVQFCRANDAARSIKMFNEKRMANNRPIIVDLAIDKDVYDKQQQNEPETSTNDDNDNSNEDESELDENSDNLLKWEISTNPTVEEKPIQIQSVEDKSELMSRTVFVKNISWVTQMSDFKRFMTNKFGTTEDCRFVIDKQLNQPKGTAFVRFSSIDHFNKCVTWKNNENGEYVEEDITLDGNVLEFLPALTPENLSDKVNERKKQQLSNDKRNLTLSNLGLAYNNQINNQAEDAVYHGVTLSDNEKKMHADAMKAKQSKLKNTNFFVSRTRICIRNIPNYVDETTLSRVYQILGGKSCRLKQVRLARFNPNNAKDKKGKSKGYGFVEFNTHECALKALKASANRLTSELFPPTTSVDPTTPAKPTKTKLMVDFSVENIQALNKQIKAKQRARRAQSNKNNGERFFHANHDKSKPNLKRKRKNPFERDIKIKD